MFRLEATLVATTLMRPWRTGWSVARGVDFSFAPTTTAVTTASATRADLAPAECACFIDEGWTGSADTAAVRTLVNPVAATAGTDTVAEAAYEAPGLRAWWTLAGKPSRT